MNRFILILLGLGLVILAACAQPDDSNPEDDVHGIYAIQAVNGGYLVVDRYGEDDGPQEQYYPEADALPSVEWEDIECVPNPSLSYFSEPLPGEMSYPFVTMTSDSHTFELHYKGGISRDGNVSNVAWKRYNSGENDYLVYVGSDSGALTVEIDYAVDAEIVADILGSSSAEAFFEISVFAATEQGCMNVTDEFDIPEISLQLDTRGNDQDPAIDDGEISGVTSFDLVYPRALIVVHAESGISVNQHEIHDHEVRSSSKIDATINVRVIDGTDK